MMTFVYAQDAKGGIGYQNDIPWHLPDDLKHFKRVTMGKTIVMGRRTFESMNCRLLPGRKTIVVTNQTDYGRDIEGLTIVNDLDVLRDLAQQEELMVIGGAGLFNHLWADVDVIIRTVIDAEYPADVFMPEIDSDKFVLQESQSKETEDSPPLTYHYEWWVRKRD